MTAPPTADAIPRVKFSPWLSGRIAGLTETTSDFTKAKNPRTRYWKGAVEFKAGDDKWAKIVTFPAASIPGNPGQNNAYGATYVYFGLPIEMRAVIDKIIRDDGRTPDIDERRIVPDNACWWKISNEVSHIAGLLVGEELKWLKATDIFAKTNQAGFKANLTVTFDVRAKTEDLGELRSDTPFTVSANIVRGIITSVGEDVNRPTLMVSTKVDPSAIRLTTADKATDDLLRALDVLKIDH